MKRTLPLICTLILFSLMTTAQSPQAFNYQAVARDATGQILGNQSVSFRISILQGGTAGSSVYSETHTLSTNTYGLANLAIGNGVLGNGDFPAIDWGADSYFVQIEMDETGGNNYQLMGTSQLVSVPYALHAETALVVPGDADTDPTNELQDISIVDHDLSLSNGSTLTLPDEINDADADPTNELQDISIVDHDLTISSGSTLTLPDEVDDADADPTNEIELPLGGADGQVLSTDGSGNYSWVDVTTTYSVGDFAHGGVVFWVDETGTHGLVCALSDQSAGIQWYNGTSLDTRALRTGVYGGATNTERITDTQGSGSYAAFICAQYDGGDYGDWYLPAKGELHLMYQNKATINATVIANGGTELTTDFYWSSTETSVTSASSQSFDLGFQGSVNKVGLSRARAIRAF